MPQLRSLDFYCLFLFPPFISTLSSLLRFWFFFSFFLLLGLSYFFAAGTNHSFLSRFPFHSGSSLVFILYHLSRLFSMPASLSLSLASSVSHSHLLFIFPIRLSRISHLSFLLFYVHLPLSFYLKKAIIFLYTHIYIQYIYAHIYISLSRFRFCSPFSLFFLSFSRIRPTTKRQMVDVIYTQRRNIIPQNERNLLNKDH